MAQALRIVDLGKRATQAVFGEMVGMTQQAVSDLRSRGVISDGQSLGKWLRAYCQQLREAAAGRGGENPLATERARLAREQADRVARENAADRGELLPAALLESALADMARQGATHLEALVPNIKRACPDLPVEALNLIERSVATLRANLAGMQLFAAANEDEADEEAA